MKAKWSIEMMQDLISIEDIEEIDSNYSKKDNETNKERVPLILKEGSLQYMKDVYGMIPVFLSSIYGVLMLKVDVNGLPLVADIPSLVGHGAYIWFEEGTGPKIWRREEYIPI